MALFAIGLISSRFGSLVVYPPPNERGLTKRLEIEPRFAIMN